jgi:transcriptional regulator with XRE-family HTH domain
MEVIHDPENVAILADNLRREMRNREKPLTQQQLAAAAGVQQSAISRILNAQNEPSLWIVLRLAEALGVTTDTLLRRRQSKFASTPHLRPARILQKVS